MIIDIMLKGIRTRYAELEKQLEDVRELKNNVVKSQKYEEAARLRDD